MLGWHISVCRQTDRQESPATFESPDRWAGRTVIDDDAVRVVPRRRVVS